MKMFLKKITIAYVTFCILAVVVYGTEVEDKHSASVSQTVENGVKTTKTQIDGGKEQETIELISPSPEPISPCPEPSSPSPEPLGPGQKPISPGPIVGNIRVKVTEYYETLCTGSRKFFKELFQPNYIEFKDYVEFILVPWGFAEITSDGSIRCQHDDAECTGNKYQACALKLGKYEEDQLNYSSCVMTTDGVEAYTSCGQGMANFAEIEACAKGEDGIKYLKELGEITKQAQPPLKTIPAMYIEGKPLTEEEKAFMWNDFVSFMCTKLTSVKPKCCDGRPTSPPPPGPPQNQPECHSGSHSPEVGPSGSPSFTCSPSPMSPSPTCSPPPIYQPPMSPSSTCSPSPMSPSPTCSPPPIYPPPMSPSSTCSPSPMSPSPHCSSSPIPPSPIYSPPPIYPPPISPTPYCSPSPMPPSPIYSPPPIYPPPMSPSPDCSPAPIPPTPTCSPSPVYPRPLSPASTCSPSPTSPSPIYPPPPPYSPSCSPSPLSPSPICSLSPTPASPTCSP